MRPLIIFAASALLFGCAPKEEPATATAPPANAGSGVTPVAGGAAGGMSPVGGSESVDGAGMGGLGNAAKDQARRAAAGGSPSVGAGEGME